MMGLKNICCAKMRRFLFFSFFSGLGWLCDFGTFALLVHLFDFSPFSANFFSSYVGVTFVWFASLKSVFGALGSSQGKYLFGYWVFQFVSIFLYSQLLAFAVLFLQSYAAAAFKIDQLEVLAKVIVTPFNLITNFIFMKFLVRFMRKSIYE